VDAFLQEFVVELLVPLAGSADVNVKVVDLGLGVFLEQVASFMEYMQQTRNTSGCLASREPTQWMMATDCGVRPSRSTTWPPVGPEALTKRSTSNAV